MAEITKQISSSMLQTNKLKRSRSTVVEAYYELMAINLCLEGATFIFIFNKVAGLQIGIPEK